jgi:hypothetical protein
MGCSMIISTTAAFGVPVGDGRRESVRQGRKSRRPWTTILLLKEPRARDDQWKGFLGRTIYVYFTDPAPKVIRDLETIECLRRLLDLSTNVGGSSTPSSVAATPMDVTSSCGMSRSSKSSRPSSASSELESASTSLRSRTPCVLLRCNGAPVMAS